MESLGGQGGLGAVIFLRCAFNGFNSAGASCFWVCLVKEHRRGKLAKLVEISLGHRD